MTLFKKLWNKVTRRSSVRKSPKSDHAVVDLDFIEVHSARHEGDKVIFSATWIDGITGERRASLQSEWRDDSELLAFLGRQGWNDVLRAVLISHFDRASGRFDHAKFETMTGTTYRIQQKVQRV